jgi:hypothetical protein
MDHEEYREALAARALGALEEGEQGALEEHLRACQECAWEAVGLHDAASMLAHLPSSIAPPARVRENLLRRVRAGEATRVVGTGAEAQAPRGGDERGRVLRPSPERFERPRGSGWSSRAMTYAAVAAAVVLAISAALLWGQNRALRGEVARLGSESAAAREEAARQREALAREREVVDLLAAPEGRVMSLAGTKDAPRAHACFAYDHASGHAVLVASGLPPAPAGKAYQMWYIAGGKPMPGPTFETDTTGRSEMRAVIPAEGRDAKQFAVTLEPESGVQAPTGSMYLLGSVISPAPADANTKS